MKPTIITLTGPTCAGKTTLQKMLVDAGMKRLRTATTRRPREHETASDYLFLSELVFAAMVDEGAMLEHVQVTRNGGSTYYGTPAKEVEEAIRTDPGARLVVVVDPAGAEAIGKACVERGWGHLAVFVDAIDVIRYQRLLARYTEDLASKASDEGREEVVKTYAARLSSMFKVESKWIQEAWAEPESTKLLLPHFDHDSAPWAVNLISTASQVMSRGGEAVAA